MPAVFLESIIKLNEYVFSRMRRHITPLQVPGIALSEWNSTGICDSGSVDCILDLQNAASSISGPRESNRVNALWNASLTVPVGPLRFFATMISAMPG